MSKLQAICLKFIFIVATVIIAVVLLTSLTYNTVVSMNYFEIPHIYLNAFYYFLIFVIFSFLLNFFNKTLAKIPSHYICISGLVLFSIAGLYLVFKADSFLRSADPRFCYLAAKRMNAGNFIDLHKGHYLSYYPYQLYWVSFERLVLKIHNSVRFLYLVNFFISLGIFGMLYAITCVVSKSNAVRNNSVILSILFLPGLFNILFVYGNVLGYLLFLLSFFFLIKGMQGKSFYLYLSVLCMVMSYLIKNNFLIGLLTLFIVIVISQVSWKHKLALIVLSLISIMMANFSINSIYSQQSKTDVEISNSIPKSSYIAMGLQEKDPGKPGWFDGYNITVYQRNHNSPVKADNASKRYIHQRLHEFAKYPSRGITFFKNKVVSTWSDPTYQSIWNGPLPGWGGHLSKGVMTSIYGGGRLNKILRRISQLNNWLILLMSFYLCLICLRSKQINTLFITAFSFCSIFIIGGFLFHFMWETKAQYVYQYVETLIPTASVAMNILYKRLADANLDSLFKRVDW